MTNLTSGFEAEWRGRPRRLGYPSTAHFAQSVCHMNSKSYPNTK